MMTLVSLDGSRRKLVMSVISEVVSPCQLTMARELMLADGRPDTPEELLFWLRLNMPVAAERIDSILYPHD